jgi:hypothetical protein
MQALAVAKPERLLDATRILELANKAYSLYLSQNPAEKAQKGPNRRMVGASGFEPPTSWSRIVLAHNPRQIRRRASGTQIID